MKTKIVLLGLALLIVGVMLVASTIYQEKVGEAEEEHHMEVPSIGKYEWRSRNMVITVVGVLLIVFGSVCIIAYGAKARKQWLKE